MKGEQLSRMLVLATNRHDGQFAEYHRFYLELQHLEALNANVTGLASAQEYEDATK